MNTYEMIVILTQKISDEERKENITKISDLISQSGEISSVDEWGMKKLAYEINKEKEGNYYLFNFNAKPDSIKELERVLRINDSVLKFMVIKK